MRPDAAVAAGIAAAFGVAVAVAVTSRLSTLELAPFRVASANVDADTDSADRVRRLGRPADDPLDGVCWRCVARHGMHVCIGRCTPRYWYLEGELYMYCLEPGGIVDL